MRSVCLGLARRTEQDVLSSGRLVSIAFEKELLVSRGLFNVDCSHKIPDCWMSMSNLHSKLLVLSFKVVPRSVEVA